MKKLLVLVCVLMAAVVFAQTKPAATSPTTPKPAVTAPAVKPTTPVAQPTAAVPVVPPAQLGQLRSLTAQIQSRQATITALQNALAPHVQAQAVLQAQLNALMNSLAVPGYTLDAQKGIYMKVIMLPATPVKK